MSSKILKIEDNKSKRDSLIITAILSLLILFIVFNYTWKVEKKEPNIEIAILFEDELLPPPPEEPIVPEPIIQSPQNSSPSQQASASNKNTTATGKENSSKYNTPTKIISQVQKRESPVSAQPNSQDKNLNKEENKRTSNTENEALQNMRKNRNQANGSDGKNPNGNIRGSRINGNGIGTGTGEGVIGEGGRFLVGKVPGTEGDTRASLTSPCSESGRVTFKYTVDKTGKITSVYRISGASDACLEKTGIDWIKNYVKANAGETSAAGTYNINFR